MTYIYIFGPWYDEFDALVIKGRLSIIVSMFWILKKLHCVAFQHTTLSFATDLWKVPCSGAPRQYRTSLHKRLHLQPSSTNRGEAPATERRWTLCAFGLVSQDPMHEGLGPVFVALTRSYAECLCFWHLESACTYYWNNIKGKNEALHEWGCSLLAWIHFNYLLYLGPFLE